MGYRALCPNRTLCCSAVIGLRLAFVGGPKRQRRNAYKSWHPSSGTAARRADGLPRPLSK